MLSVGVARERWLTVGLPMIVSWSLCFYGSGDRAFRGDELCTWWAASLPPDSFARLARYVDGVLAPYYLFMRYWMSVFGDSEAAMRAPAGLLMGACAGVVAQLGARLSNRAVGLRAGLLFALMPVVSRYGQEARPYAFAMFFAALSSLLLLRLIDEPKSLARAAGYAGAVIALGFSHLLGLLIVRRTPRASCAFHTRNLTCGF
jgi:mannosyltransferase